MISDLLLRNEQRKPYRWVSYQLLEGWWGESWQSNLGIRREGKNVKSASDLYTIQSPGHANVRTFFFWACVDQASLVWKLGVDFCDHSGDRCVDVWSRLNTFHGAHLIYQKTPKNIRGRSLFSKSSLLTDLPARPELPIPEARRRRRPPDFFEHSQWFQWFQLVWQDQTIPIRVLSCIVLLQSNGLESRRVIFSIRSASWLRVMTGMPRRHESWWGSMRTGCISICGCD